MFHNTTTLWHNNDFHTSFVKEKRMPRMAAEKAKAVAKASGSGLKVLGRGLWKGFKWVTFPARIVLWPITKPLSLGTKYIPRVLDKFKMPIKATREAAAGVFKGSIYGGMKELVKAPLICIQKNLVHNFRDVIKGVFKTPGNVIRIPKNMWLGLKNGISKTRSRVGKIVKNVKSGQPVRAFGNTISLPFSIAATPVRMVGRPSIELAKPAKPVAENIGNGLMAYPRGIQKSVKNVRSGIDRTLNCVKTAKQEVAATETASNMAELPAKQASEKSMKGRGAETIKKTA